LALQTATQEVFRGYSIEVSGQATSPTGPAAKLRIEVILSKENEEDTRLGSVATDASGNFKGTFTIPSDQSLGTYKITLVTPGDTTYAPSATIAP
jgi:uncharacterized protein YfaS (alpha-2-macroglobulin family)